MRVQFFHHQKNILVFILLLCIQLIKVNVYIKFIIMKQFTDYNLCLRLCSSVNKAIFKTYRKRLHFLISLQIYPVINFIGYIVLWLSSTFNIVWHRRHYWFPALFIAAHVLRSPAHRLQDPGNFSYRTFIDDTGALPDNRGCTL